MLKIPQLCPHLMSAFQQDQTVMFVFLLASLCQCISVSAECTKICSLFCIFALISFPGPRLAISFLSKQPDLMLWWNIQIKAIYTKMKAIKIYVKTKVSESCFKLNARIYLFFLWKFLGYSVSGLAWLAVAWKLFWLCKLCLLIE